MVNIYNPLNGLAAAAPEEEEIDCRQPSTIADALKISPQSLHYDTEPALYYTYDSDDLEQLIYNTHKMTSSHLGHCLKHLLQYKSEETANMHALTIKQEIQKLHQNMPWLQKAEKLMRREAVAIQEEFNKTHTINPGPEVADVLRKGLLSIFDNMQDTHISRLCRKMTRYLSDKLLELQQSAKQCEQKIIEHRRQYIDRLDDKSSTPQSKEQMQERYYAIGQDIEKHRRLRNTIKYIKATLSHQQPPSDSKRYAEVLRQYYLTISRYAINEYMQYSLFMHHHQQSKRDHHSQKSPITNALQKNRTDFNACLAIIKPTRKHTEALTDMMLTMEINIYHRVTRAALEIMRILSLPTQEYQERLSTTLSEEAEFLRQQLQTRNMRSIENNHINNIIMESTMGNKASDNTAQSIASDDDGDDGGEDNNNRNNDRHEQMAGEKLYQLIREMLTTANTMKISEADQNKIEDIFHKVVDENLSDIKYFKRYMLIKNEKLAKATAKLQQRLYSVILNKTKAVQTILPMKVLVTNHNNSEFLTTKTAGSHLMEVADFMKAELDGSIEGMKDLKTQWLKPEQKRAPSERPSKNGKIFKTVFTAISSLFIALYNKTIYLYRTICLRLTSIYLTDQSYTTSCQAKTAEIKHTTQTHKTAISQLLATLEPTATTEESRATQLDGTQAPQGRYPR